MPLVEAFPLSWPAGWKRTPANDRRNPKFHRTEMRSYASGGGYRAKKEITVYDAVGRVRSELEKFGVLEHTIIISTNIETRNDGTPRSDRRAINGDPGVAVYWADPDSGAQQCMAIDLYDTVAGNLAAVAASIEALRAIERHGGATILKRAFEGFKALSSATTAALSTEQAADVLSRRTGRAAPAILTDRDVARRAYREAASSAHPDAGGSTSDFQLVQEAKRVLEGHHGGAL